MIMHEELGIKRETYCGGVLNIELHGNLDANTFEQFDNYMQEVIDNEYSRYVLLDLGGITGLSSAGAGILISVTEQFRRLNGLIVLYNASDKITSILEILGMSKIESGVSASLALVLTKAEAIAKLPLRLTASTKCEIV